MDILGPLLRTTLKPLASYLNQPCASAAPVATSLDRLARVLVPGDVILVEGNTRFASLVRVLTQSTWSHVAMFVGPLDESADPACIVEADIERGVRTLPMSELRDMNVRVLRASGLSAAERAQVASRALARVGQMYDLDYVVDLACSFIRGRNAGAHPVPVAAAERAICSTLLAQAFAEVGYPILPRPSRAADAPARVRVCTPRDFDLSPFFTVVSTAAPHSARPQPSAALAGLPAGKPAALLLRVPAPTLHV